MKINCDYCGSQFDTDQYDTCPSCGGIYSRDKEVLTEKEKLDKADELFMQQRELENERLRIENERLRNSGTKTSAKGCVISFMFLIIAAVLLIILALIASESESKEKNKEPDTGKATVTTHRIDLTYSISMTPIEIPEIVVPTVPDIKIEVPDITTLNN